MPVVARPVLRCLTLLLALLALPAGPALAADEAGDFDFYVLSLSWSPSYCEAEGAGADPAQCRSARPRGFVVHGLWPQRERGFPERCRSGEGDVPRAMARSLADIMPSAGLVRHEWRRHGACSGLSQAGYFALLRHAWERVAIPTPFRGAAARRAIAPREAENAFRQANPGLTPEGVAVTCADGLLREVRICMTKNLGFRACAEVDRRACRQAKVTMPPAAAP